MRVIEVSSTRVVRWDAELVLWGGVGNDVIAGSRPDGDSQRMHISHAHKRVMHSRPHLDFFLRRTDTVRGVALLVDADQHTCSRVCASIGVCART